MFYDMTPQPIQNRRSADSSPVLTPSGSPHWIEGKMQHFFAAFEGPNGGGLGRGWQSDDNEALRQGRQGGGNGNASAGPSRGEFSRVACMRQIGQEMGSGADIFSSILQYPCSSTPFCPFLF